MKQNYSELLKDPRWQRRKSEIMQRDNYTCQLCGCKTKQLHVHHKFYDGRNPWEYEDDALITLCEDCHNKEHNKVIPKVGKFYTLYHSDFCNDMVCYHIDYKNKLVYLFGVDSGGYANGYIYIEPYEHICNCKESQIIPENPFVERDTYSLSSLYYAYADLLKGEVEIYGRKMYEDYFIIDYAKKSVKEIFDSNKMLTCVFEEFNQEEGLL